MAVTSAQVVVGTTATALNTSSNQGQRLYLSNPTPGQTVFLGDSSVTTSIGYGLLAGATLKIDVDPYEVIYGIVAGTTATVGVLRA